MCEPVLFPDPWAMCASVCRCCSAETSRDTSSYLPDGISAGSSYLSLFIALWWWLTAFPGAILWNLFKLRHIYMVAYMCVSIHISKSVYFLLKQKTFNKEKCKNLTWHQQPVWNRNANIFTATRGGPLIFNLAKCQDCSLKAHQSEQQGICMINTAAQGLVHNEPSLIHNLQAKSRADLSRHHWCWCWFSTAV